MLTKEQKTDFAKQFIDRQQHCVMGLLAGVPLKDGKTTHNPFQLAEFILCGGIELLESFLEENPDVAAAEIGDACKSGEIDDIANSLMGNQS